MQLGHVIEQCKCLIRQYYIVETENNDIAVANGYIFIFKIQKYNFCIQQKWIRQIYLANCYKRRFFILIS